MTHKNTSRLYIIFVIAIFIIISGCKTLLFKSTFGDVIKIENPEEYEGIWESEDKIIAYLKVKNDSMTIIMGYVDWDKDQEKFITKNEEMFISQVNEMTFMNTKTENGEFKIQQFEIRDTWHPGQRQILTWEPDVDKFEQLVESEDLPGKLIKSENQNGEVETDSVIVDKLNYEQISEILQSENLFKYKEVKILRSIFNVADFEKFK